MTAIIRRGNLAGVGSVDIIECKLKDADVRYRGYEVRRGGLIYLVLFVYGAIWHDETSTNWIPVDWADNVLHLVLGIGMVVAGVVLAKDVVRRDRPAPAV